MSGTGLGRGKPRFLSLCLLLFPAEGWLPATSSRSSIQCRILDKLGKGMTMSYRAAMVLDMITPAGSQLPFRLDYFDWSVAPMRGENTAKETA